MAVSYARRIELSPVAAPPGTVTDARRARPVLAGGRLPLLGLTVLTAAIWAGLGWLAVAFLRSSLDWEYVAEQSRVDAPWYYRLAGVWGGMEGSLLLFTGIVAAVAVVAARRAPPAVAGVALATVAALGTINVALASPFGRAGVPVTLGFGLNPILEHPAMAIHPPLLYAGLAATGGGAIAAAGGRRLAAQRWLLGSLGLLASAMVLGGAWSYMEQGWGGYWAWDPVENTSLLVWIAALVAVHLAPIASRAVAAAAALAPWVVALLGATLVRSGRTVSVHTFAEQGAVGWALFGLTVATTAACVVAVRRAMSNDPRYGADRSSRRWWSDPRAVTVVLAAVAGVLVLVATFGPPLVDVLGAPESVVHGSFYSRTVGPLALATVPFLALRLRRPVGWSTIAHAGALVVLAGVGASTWHEAGTVPIAAGATVEAAGTEVRNDGVDVGAGPRRGTEAVTATVDVAGHRMTPSIVVYPERGGRLAEVAVHTGVWTDTHALLERASDDGTIVVTVQRRHGMWLVWAGAAVVTAGTLGAARRPRGDGHLDTSGPPPGR